MILRLVRFVLVKPLLLDEYRLFCVSFSLSILRIVPVIPEEEHVL